METGKLQLYKRNSVIIYKMKISVYEGICPIKNNSYKDLAYELEEKITSILVNKYDTKMIYPRLALVSLLPILFVSNGNLKDKKILDLGCGCNNPILEGGFFHDRMFEPWLCRGLYEIALKPIGIDCGPLEGELFEHYKLNLLKEKSLEFLPDNSIDIANAKGLFSSSFLNCEYLGLGSSGEELKKVLMPQLERIVTT